MESELLARLEALGVDIEAHEEDIKQDAEGCNCDLDYQCFNVECREHLDRELAYWSRYFTPTMIEAYRSDFDPNYNHNDCGVMCPHKGQR